MNAAGLLRSGLKAGAFCVMLLLASDAMAKTTGIGDDPALQKGPCYDALVDKNAATPTTAPNRELGSACEAEHGDVDKAWARVIRLWGSDSTDVPDYDSYRRADAPVDAGMPRWLALIGLLLTYAVLGMPMRSAARLMRAYPGPAQGALVDVVTSLVLRGLVAAALVGLFGLPYVGALASVALIVWTPVRMGLTAPAPLDPATGSLGAHIAETFNDSAGAFAGLAGLALFAQHSALTFIVGWMLALVVSAGPVIVARRALRSNRLRASLSAAALAGALCEASILLPPFSGWAQGSTTVAVMAPVAAMGLTLAAGLVSKWRVASTERTS